MKFGVVNKTTTVNRFVLNTLQRNITHLAVITRNIYIKLGILKGGNWKRAKSSCNVLFLNINCTKTCLREQSNKLVFSFSEGWETGKKWTIFSFSEGGGKLEKSWQYKQSFAGGKGVGKKQKISNSNQTNINQTSAALAGPLTNIITAC